MSLHKLRARFAPVFDEIAAGAVERERERTLPFGPIRRLADAGFGAVRVPVEFGGAGASLPDFFELVADLAEADPNVAQALRGHIGVVERLLLAPPRGNTATWLRRVADGELIGNAQSEQADGTGISTTLTHADGKWLVTGTKYYTTGTIFSDWTWLSAIAERGTASFPVRTTSVGVTVADDWDGFGQRMTGSGTTIFENVEVDEDDIEWLSEEEPFVTTDFRVVLHLILLATLVGVGRAVLRDATDYVTSRTRIYGVPGLTSPRNEPTVHVVVGNIAVLAFAAEAAVRDVVNRLDAVRGQQDAADVLDRYVAVQIAQFSAQQVVIRSVTEAANQLFEVGGASAVSSTRGLDRHWRNARTLASHNPAIRRQAAIGDYLLNGTAPETSMRRPGTPVTASEILAR